jgi:hypothetical protein
MIQGGQMPTRPTEGERPGEERTAAFRILPLAGLPGSTAQSLPQKEAERPVQGSFYMAGPSFA